MQQSIANCGKVIEVLDVEVEELDQKVSIAACQTGAYKQFGNYEIVGFEDLDGYKYHIGNDRWVMIRPSGTEPVLRVYAEAETSEQAFEILETVKGVILG